MNNQIGQDIQTILSENLPWEVLRGKTIAISGTRGFIASWIKNLLQSLDLDIKILELNKEFCDINDLKKELIIWPIDYIFHAASYASPTKFKENPVDVILPNTIGTYNLLELAREKKSTFVFFSTSGVYGWHPFENYPLSENKFGPLNCAEVENCYLESKRLGENLCVSYNYKYDIPIRILRLGICYGPGLKLDDGRVMNTFIKKVLDKKSITVYNEHLYRSFMYITDVISAIFHILFKGDNEPYNIAAEKEISIHKLGELFCELYSDSKLEEEEREDRLSVDFLRTWMNTGKLQSLGWKQKVALKDGIKRTVESYR